MGGGGSHPVGLISTQGTGGGIGAAAAPRQTAGSVHGRATISHFFYGNTRFEVA